MFNHKCALYIVESTSGHFKIGISDNPKKRLKQLQKTQGPYVYSLAFYWWFPNKEEARKTESKLHHLYRGHRVNGEWFIFTPRDLVSIGQDMDLIRGGK